MRNQKGKQIMNSEALRQELLALDIKPEDLHVYVDMDGTLYEWRNLSVDIPSDFEDMGEEARDAYIHREIYKQLLTPGYYKSLAPYPEMLSFATALHEAGVDIRILSCSINFQTDAEKRFALSRDLPWLTEDAITFVPDGQGEEKAYYLPNIADAPRYYTKDALHVLIDDHTANCKAFEGAIVWGTYGELLHNFSAIKCVNDINHKRGYWQKNVLNHDNTDISMIQFLEHIKSLPYIQERGNDYDADRGDNGILQRE